MPILTSCSLCLMWTDTWTKNVYHVSLYVYIETNTIKLRHLYAVGENCLWQGILSQQRIRQLKVLQSISPTKQASLTFIQLESW